MYLFVSLPYLRNIVSNFSIFYLQFQLSMKPILLFWIRFLINCKINVYGFYFLQNNISNLHLIVMLLFGVVSRGFTSKWSISSLRAHSLQEHVKVLLQ